MAKGGSQAHQPANRRKDQAAFLSNDKAADPNLASLFASSSRPDQIKVVDTSGDVPFASRERTKSEVIRSSSLLSSSRNSNFSHAHVADPRLAAEWNAGSVTGEIATIPDLLSKGGVSKQGRKRRHHESEDDLESTYMRRLAKDETLEDEHQQGANNHKRHKSSRDVPTTEAELSDSNASISGSEVDLKASVGVEKDNVLQHETLTPSGEAVELEKSSRTVFLANVSTSAIKSKTSKKVLLEHLASFLPALPEDGVPQKVESIRFRSTAFSSTAMPKKAAFAKKELMDATTKSTNAYAVYSTALAAREAAKRLNGTIVLDRHLRVDNVAHPARTDHKRCVFVGNLGFVDDESSLHAAEDMPKEKKSSKTKQAADVEEGLWREFGKAGTVESVRVVRDKSTRVGKGIAYVQYINPNAVEAALLLNDKKFPPLLPRKMRVTRAKSMKKTTLSSSGSGSSSFKSSTKTPRSSGYDPKTTPEAKTFQGRAGKLLGHAGAAKLTSNRPYRREGPKNVGGFTKTPESFVFEGYRASSKPDRGLKGQGKKQGKPKTRSSRRGAAFKISGRKKGMK